MFNKAIEKTLKLIKTPNFLTVSRIFAAPFFLFLCVFLPRDVLLFRLISGFLFSVIAATDLLDGYLARKNSEVSTFGICFDNIADKMLTILTLLGMLATKRVGITLVAIIITRELLVTGIREFIAMQKNGHMPVTKLSKIKTTVQMVGIILLLISDKDTPFELIGTVVLWIGAYLAVTTLYQYVRTVLKYIKKADNS
ncbi:MAG: CDP-diacylglycerol--glycerol-3-phosphate 3-phosphatidyltransferase [Alphaproteobacteria bacterium]|nr:CDP-diacylglycerol--glycerol-3-phosphate 3-phosphatidyltransferase [Rickettsiales bacterium]